MSDTLAHAKSMSFETASTSPFRGPNGQWLHLLKTAHVEMQRPNKLRIDAGGDAFPQSIFYDGKTYSVEAKGTHLYSQENMPAESIDAMLGQAEEKGGNVFASRTSSSPTPTPRGRMGLTARSSSANRRATSSSSSTSRSSRRRCTGKSGSERRITFPTWSSPASSASSTLPRSRSSSPTGVSMVRSRLRSSRSKRRPDPRERRSRLRLSKLIDGLSF